MHFADNPRIAVIGLGYVGLPLAVALARHYETVGVSRVVFFLPSTGADVIEPILDRYAKEFLVPLR